MSSNNGEPNCDQIEIANEYAQVRIKKITTSNGERIEIQSPKLESAIRLDPVEVESLTWQDKEIFSRFLETPYGPMSE
jgi:hypothetical protein